jgi:hypothetical protein
VIKKTEAVVHFNKKILNITITNHCRNNKLSLFLSAFCTLHKHFCDANIVLIFGKIFHVLSYKLGGRLLLGLTIML